MIINFENLGNRKKLHRMDVLKQLDPLYRKHEEVSLAGMDGHEFITTTRTLHFCKDPFEYVIELAKGTSNYTELSNSLTSSIHNPCKDKEPFLSIASHNKSYSQEEFVENVEKKFAHVPLPPIHKSVTGTYSQITDIPPVLMCEGETTFLFEESCFFQKLMNRLLYGRKTVDELVNNSTTAFLEQFLYMRPEIITNSYVSFLRDCYQEVIDRNN